MLPPWQRRDLEGPTEPHFHFRWMNFWIKKDRGNDSCNHDCMLLMYVSSPAWKCWNNRTIVTRIESYKSCSHVLNHTADETSDPANIPRHVSCWVESLCVDLADVAALSLPPYELWLTCSLIYSQWGADDGPGCVRRGQGSRWCDQHNKEATGWLSWHTPPAAERQWHLIF